MELKGVYPALATPLTPEEKVDKAGLRKVVRYCLEGGVHGILVLGTTGEFPALNEAARQDAFETALREVGGKVPVLIGCGDTSTQKTIQQVRVAAKTPAAALLVAVPYYYPLDQEAVERHFLMVAEASEKPIMIYHFPQMTKVAVQAETFGKLAAHPNIIGVKDSSGDFVSLQRNLEATAGQNFVVFTGNPAIGLAVYMQGGKGGIYSGCNLVPKLCVEVYNAYCRGDLTTAAALQKTVSRISLAGTFGPSVAVIKYSLHKLGLCGPTVTAPLAVPPGQDEKICAWLRSLGLEV